MTQLNRLLATIALAAATIGAPLPAAAQDFPSKPVTIICPWPAGGTTDQYFRAFAQIASKYLGQQVVVENKPGAGGTLGAVALASTAKPDGYTISQIPISVFRFPHMQKTQFDPTKDFTYIVGLSGYTFGIIVRPETPWMTFQDFIAAGKAKPGTITYGTPGTGTSPHLLVEDLQQKTGAKFQHVPFKGNAEGMNAFLGGHIDAVSDSSGWGTHVDAGKARLLATFGEQRTKRWPSVPTAKDLGIDLVYPSPFGLAGPKGMDPKVVATLHDAFKKALDDPEHQKILDKLDQVLWYRNTADYTKIAMESIEFEKQTIERLGLAKKE
jgi:tripartite-type tricarboxylate transporter receptor subunit TctC